MAAGYSDDVDGVDQRIFLGIDETFLYLYHLARVSSIAQTERAENF